MTPPTTRTHNPVAIQRNPNPQGKGMVPVLRDWSTMQPTVSGPKSPPDFLRDYCISSLVLAAHFRFKPVVGRDYFLYGSEQGWSLSLIAPHEWGQRKAGQCVACCRLRPDMTWHMDTSPLEEHSPAVAMARTFIRDFVDALAGQASLTDHLPFYVASLPYYQRLLATALASSLQRTLPSNSDDMRALLRSSSHIVPSLLAIPARAPALLAAGSGH